MDNIQLPAVLAIVTPDIIKRLMEGQKTDYEQAASMLYGSKLYTALESYETGLWKLSPLTLYNLLREELTTGTITFPEEQ